ncbi:enoyl-CoA hydratase-related protein [Georgenia subflava]|uniref:Enoyl-CoA hydratase n=1 Tax=Georgenia subflava TaxID=1622177 RepID=A0A6N7EQG1_9MICO|nr:enoyl-CoA hydratase-related protein [Georgenia subflava]MPV37444.1 enoyl-CoA hydratase [Georgenia subflava]
MVASEHVRVDRDGHVLVLTLDRPAKKNALTAPMYEVLAEAVTSAGDDPQVRCVLLRAEGDSFCAGNDIADFLTVRDRAEEGGDAQQLWATVSAFLTALARTRVPVVAAVQRRAVGVGLTMLLHCDLVYLAEDARLSAPFVDLGLVPEAASSLTLPARIGHARAFAVLVLGETVDAAQALGWGLANAVVPPDELDDRARRAAGQVAARAPEAVGLTKSLMRDSDALEERIAKEGKLFMERLRSPDVAHILTARMRGLGSARG